MGDILQQIIADKRNHIERRRSQVSDSQILMAAKAAPAVLGFAGCLEKSVHEGNYGLIAEIKKASPSKGIIRENFDPPALAKAYAGGGASCLSVLTDRPYFQGADEFIKQARDVAGLPVLRKDFMVDLYQIAESRALGADCILLIMAILDDKAAYTLTTAARGLDMDVLFEVHNKEELERTEPLEPKLVGINNRNLKTFEVDLATTETLAPLAPDNAIVISESGLATPQHLSRMSAVGVNCFLIGESLMRADDVARATSELLTPFESPAITI
jgi:indole-3-glycerol phosphate synthase